MLRFSLRLAGHLGKTLQELSDSLGHWDDIPEEYLWIAYWGLEPFGEEWLQTSQICSILANIHRDPKKKPVPWDNDDFMPVPKRRKEQSPVEQEQRFLTALAHLRKKPSKKKAQTKKPKPKHT